MWLASPEATAAKVVKLTPDNWAVWRMQGRAQVDLFFTMPNATPEQRKKKADVLSEAMKSFMKASRLAGEEVNARDKDLGAEMAREMIPIIQRLRE